MNALLTIHPHDVPKIPSELSELCGYSVACPCGRTHEVDLRHAVIDQGAIESLFPIIKEVGKSLKIGVVADRVTLEIAGNAIAKRLGSDGHHVRVITVPDGAGDRPHADEPNLRLVQNALSDRDLAVSVGSGTINDLTKLSSFNLKRPYVSVATAPSMNGYTSAIAAILVKGVKRTIPCHQPMAVIADLDILKDAPIELSRAGLGDLESKPTATADFRLGNMLREDYYCPAPEQVVLAAENRAADLAEGLGKGNLHATAALTEALMLSGITMKLAGSSSTASGGEHLMSHFWDMTAHAENRVEGWHGAQVGVATIVTAALYDALRIVDPETIDVQKIISARASKDEDAHTIEIHHGEFAKEVKTEWFAKRLDDDALAKEVTTIKERWQNLWKDLDDVLRPSNKIRRILKAAGAPTTVGELKLTPKHLKTALACAMHIRNRFTILDLAQDLGLLDTLAKEVLHTSGCYK